MKLPLACVCGVFHSSYISSLAQSLHPTHGQSLTKTFLYGKLLQEIEEIVGTLKWNYFDPEMKKKRR